MLRKQTCRTKLSFTRRSIKRCMELLQQRGTLCMHRSMSVKGVFFDHNMPPQFDISTYNDKNTFDIGVCQVLHFWHSSLLRYEDRTKTDRSSTFLSTSGTPVFLHFPDMRHNSLLHSLVLVCLICEHFSHLFTHVSEVVFSAKIYCNGFRQSSCDKSQWSSELSDSDSDSEDDESDSGPGATPPSK